MMKTVSNVGFIGLGNMGFPMAGRLADAGVKLTVFDKAPKAVADFVGQYGAQAADSAGAAGAGAQAVITMLPDGGVVREVVTGASGAGDGLLYSMTPGAILIDMSSSAPSGTRRLGEQLTERGIHMLDAPVSGGVLRAKSGKLAIMVGGASDVIRCCRPIFAAMGERLFETGGPGTGHAMKVLNNLVSAAGLIAAAEAMMIGTRCGLKPETMVEVLNASTGRNNSTENKFHQFILSRAFNSGFSLDLMVKDLNTALDIAGENGVSAEFSDLCRSLWARARSSLEKGADHTAVVRWFETVNGTELKRTDLSE